MRLWPLLSDVWRGRTILRSFEDRLLLERTVLQGVTIDLGGAESGYLDLFRRSGSTTRFVVDIRPESEPDVVADLERPLPFQSESVDTLLLHNVLEHIGGYECLVAEMRRVMRTGGRLYFSVPFLFPVHELDGGYVDYQRLSARALTPLFGDFAALALETIEVGPFVAGLHVAFSAIPLRALRALLVGIAWIMDATYAKVRRRRDPRTQIRFILGYVGTATA